MPTGPVPQVLRPQLPAQHHHPSHLRQSARQRLGAVQLHPSDRPHRLRRHRADRAPLPGQAPVETDARQVRVREQNRQRHRSGPLGRRRPGPLSALPEDPQGVPQDPHDVCDGQHVCDGVHVRPSALPGVEDSNFVDHKSTANQYFVGFSFNIWKK
jgi:hypothetical protein